jgi:hypothetical protein
MTELNIPDSIPVLSRGNHTDPRDGACVMEMVSVLSGEEFSDSPTCVNSTLRTSAICVNDFVSDDNRNKIALMVPRFIGTSKYVSPVDHVSPVDKISERFKSEPRFQFLWENKNQYAKYGFKTVEDIVTELKGHFLMEKNTGKRKTNEEYDDLAILALEISLDEFDKHNERGEYEITLEDAFKQFSTHVSQTKVNA